MWLQQCLIGRQCQASEVQWTLSHINFDMQLSFDQLQMKESLKRR